MQSRQRLRICRLSAVDADYSSAIKAYPTQYICQLRQ